MEGKYNIKAVSKMLGIQAGTLRAWERRYKIIEPKRNHVGHRLYTEEQVATIKWLLQKVNNGFTIGQAVGLLEDEGIGSIADIHSDDQAVNLKNDLLQALLNFEETRSNHILDQAFGIYSVEKVVNDIIGKVLVEIGDKWEKGEISVANEHYATSYLQARVSTIIQTLPNNSYLAKVVCVCSPGELHEVGLLIFSLYLKRKGFEVIYLGSGMPEEDIIDVINQAQPKMLFLSCTIPEKVSGTMHVVNSIKDQFPNLHIGIGGSGIDHISQIKNVNHLELYVGRAKEDWDYWLGNIKS